MKRLLNTLIVCVLLLPGGTSPTQAYTLANLQTASDGTIETIPLQAAVQTSPPTISIKTYAPGTFTIKRKDPAAKTWTTIATGVGLGALASWSDTSVAVGILYEYQFINTAGTATNGIQPSGYILTGINVDQTLSKGRIALVTASDLPGSLPSEYAQYKADLIADGWFIHELQVPRAANYHALGNAALATTKVNAGGVTSIASGGVVKLTNPSGKQALGTVSVNASGAITTVSIPAGGGGTGFAINEALTIAPGGPVTKGTVASLRTVVTSTQQTLTSVAPATGGTGFASGQTVTLTGQTSGAAAQATIYASVGAIFFVQINSSQSGFVVGELLAMTGNSSGTGLGPLTAAAVSGGQLSSVQIRPTGTGYVNGDAGILTGNTTGKTAQVTLRVSGGYLTGAAIVSAQTGFQSGETMTLSGTSAGAGASLFTASVSATGPLQSIDVTSGGTGYVNGAVVTINSGSAAAQGTLVVSGGVITGVTITSPGSGFTNSNFASLGAITTGYSLAVLTVDNGGTGRPVTIAAGGSGYADADSVAIRGNSSGATAVGSILAPAGAITGISVVLPNTFTVGEALTLTPSRGGSGAGATVGASLDYHLLIRSAIQAIYNTYPGELKNIAILGKAPICRSGINDSPGSDGHGNQAAYGADAFYGEMLGTIGVDWTDTQDNSATTPASYNLPGDQQYDQQKISQVGDGGVQLGFGRIDLSMGIESEVEAMRTYFNKLHRYKVADPSFLPGRNVCDRYAFQNERETDLQSMPGVTGMENITFIDSKALPTVKSGQDADQLYSAQHGPYLFYFKGSGVPDGGAGGKAVFWTGMQSHWGYWYQNYNDMQMRLGEDSFTLDITWNVWGLRYIYHRMGMGLDAGDMMKQSINNQGRGAGPYTYKFNNTNNGDYSGVLYMNQMGDPALRLFMFAPPSRLSVVKAAGTPALSWTASPDASVSGYHVYRAPSASGPFTRLTTTPVAGTFYTDASATSGKYVYMVRAVRLETTGGGSFYNASLGVTQPIDLDNAPALPTIATTSIPNLYWNTPTSLQLTAQGGVPQYNWTVISGSLPAGLTLSSTGVLSGTANAIGAFNITVRAVDQIGQQVTQNLTVSVGSTSQARIYPVATTYTSAANPGNTYGSEDSNLITGGANPNETFHRYDLSSLVLNNGFTKATLYLYVTTNTTSNAIASVQANLIADAANGWVDNGIAKPFLSAKASPTAGWTRINCEDHGFTTGTQVTLAGLTGFSSTTPYAITSIDEDNFDIHVSYGGWAYDPAYAFADTLSVTYNTRPTQYNPNMPTLTATGNNTAGSLLQFDVTPFVRETLENIPSKQMGIRFFTGTPQTVAVGSLSAFGGAIPYLVIETSDAPKIVITSPKVDPAAVMAGSGVSLEATVTPLPARASALTMQWSQVSGPVGESFSNPTSAATGATFSALGDYVVRLTADDGVAQSQQNVMIRVLSSPVIGPIDGMVLHLPFDATSGATAQDSSGVTPPNNGTLASMPTSNPLPTWTSAGRIGGALSFSGTGQRVDVPDSATNQLDGMKQLTISAWIYANALPVGSTNYVCLLSKRNAGNKQESFTLQLRGNAGTTSALYFDVNGAGSNSSVTTVTPGKWYHVAMVYDGAQTTSNLRLYINGNPDKYITTTVTTVIRNATSAVHFGAFDPTDTIGFNGLIDEVRLYKRALSLTEIQDLNAAVPANVGPVVTTASAIAGQVGSPMPLTATIVDDGKPSGQLTYQWGQLSGPASLSILNPAVPSTSATAATPGSFNLRLTVSDGLIASFADATATVAGQTFSTWIASYGFSGSDATSGGNPARDGVPNLLKYALGLNPQTNYAANAPGLPITSIATVGGNNYLTLSFTGVATGVTYIVEATSDLTGAWTPLYTFSDPGAPGAVTVTDTQSIATSSKRFLRLRISQP